MKKVLTVLLCCLSTYIHAEIIATGLERVFHETRSTGDFQGHMEFNVRTSAFDVSTVTFINNAMGKVNTFIKLESYHSFGLYNPTNDVQLYYVVTMLCAETAGCIEDINKYKVGPQKSFTLQYILHADKIFYSATIYKTSAKTEIIGESSIVDEATARLTVYE